MWVDRNEDGSVAVGSTKFSDTAIEVEPLPAEQDELTWVEGEPLPTIDPVKVFTKKILHFESLAYAHIQSIVDAHNVANKTTFADVYRCQMYIGGVHPSALFCADVWAYNDLVWKDLRLLLIDIQAGTTAIPADDDAFMALLPVYSGA